MGFSRILPLFRLLLESLKDSPMGFLGFHRFPAFTTIPKGLACGIFSDPTAFPFFAQPPKGFAYGDFSDSTVSRLLLKSPKGLPMVCSRITPFPGFYSNL
jgi:hypothetical protein